MLLRTFEFSKFKQVKNNFSSKNLFSLNYRLIEILGYLASVRVKVQDPSESIYKSYCNFLDFSNH